MTFVTDMKVDIIQERRGRLQRALLWGVAVGERGWIQLQMQQGKWGPMAQEQGGVHV